jgi:hypothetical protein
MNILGYQLDKYPWISMMDMWLGYVWICLDISWISSVDIVSWICLKRYPILPNDIQEISFHIQQYLTISRDIQRYPEISNGANSQMMVFYMKSRLPGLYEAIRKVLKEYCVNAVHDDCPFSDDQAGGVLHQMLCSPTNSESAYFWLEEAQNEDTRPFEKLLGCIRALYRVVYEDLENAAFNSRSMQVDDAIAAVWVRHPTAS